tara:strand:- start:2265 stop:2420 length:156 start_codon:yes stop_codon:yes gene_type:complete
MREEDRMSEVKRKAAIAVRIEPETKKRLEAWAKKRGLAMSEALNLLVPKKA